MPGLPGRDVRASGHGKRVDGLRQRKNYVGVELHQPFPIVWNPFP